MAAALAELLPVASAVRADDAVDLYNVGVGLYKQERWKLAAESFRELLDKYPNHARAPLGRLYLGFTLYRSEQYQQARAEFRTFVENNPNNKFLPDAMYRVADCSWKLDDLKTAELEFTTFLERHPNHELVKWAWPYLGDAQLRQSKPESAADSFRKSLELFPQGPLAEDSQFGLAKSLEDLKKPAEALDAYRKLADTQGSRAPQALLKVGTLHFDAKRYAEAAAAYAELESRFEDSSLVPVARLNAGYAYYQLGDFGKAISQFELARQEPTQAQAADYWRGISHKGLKDYARAGDVLKAAFEADPKSSLAENSLHQWADCEMQLRRYDSAQALFVKFADAWPQSDLADDSLHFAAEAALADGRHQEAEQLAARFERDYPQSPLRLHHVLLKGRLLDAQGGQENQKKSAELFEQVLKESALPETQRLARFHLARVLQKSGDDRKALEVVNPLAEQVRQDESAREFCDALLLAGASHLALRQYADAASSVTDYLKLVPEGPQADQALATLSIAEARLGRKADSQQQLKTLIEKHPASPLLAPTTRQIAEIAYEAKDWEWSAEAFDRLVQLGANTAFHAKGLSGMAWSLQQQKKHREAAELFERLAREHPNEAELAPEAAYMAGQALQDAGDLAAAAKAYGEAFEKFSPRQAAAPGDEQKGSGYYAYRSGLQAARALRTMKDRTADADAAYQRLLERFPKPQHLDKLLDEWALLNYEAERFPRADEIFRRLINDVPDSDLADNARLSLAESDLVGGRLEEARRQLTALEADPKSDDDVKQVALSHLMAVAVENRQWPEVDARARQLIERFPEGRYRWQAEFYRAEALVQQEKIEPAQKALLELKAQEKNDLVAGADWFPRVWVLLAETYQRLKKYDDVRSTVDEFRQRDPQSPFLYQADEVLGRSYKNQARFDEAREAFRRVLDSPSGRRTETAAKSQFLIAESYLIEMDYENALKEYLKVSFNYKFPQWQAAALYQAALCDEKLNQWKEAVQTYEDLLRDFPADPFAEKAKSRLPAARSRAAE